MGHAGDKREWIILDRVVDIILENVEGCIVDIGMGMSTQVLAEYAEKYNREQYSCDILKVVAQKFGKLHKKHFTFVGSSIEFIEQFVGNVAIVFLDGNHAYEIVKQEVEFFLSVMSLYGVIFMHDTYPPEKKIAKSGRRCGTVYKLRQELEERKDLWTFTWPYKTQAQGCGLTMVMKKDMDQPFCRI